MKALLSSPLFYRYMVSTEKGATGSQKRADKTLLMSSCYWLPSLSEQQRIGAFFHLVDATLLTVQRNLAGLKELKRAYLQRMFIWISNCLWPETVTRFRPQAALFLYEQLLQIRGFHLSKLRDSAFGILYQAIQCFEEITNFQLLLERWHRSPLLEEIIDHEFVHESPSHRWAQQQRRHYIAILEQVFPERNTD